MLEMCHTRADIRTARTQTLAHITSQNIYYIYYEDLKYGNAESENSILLCEEEWRVLRVMRWWRMGCGGTPHTPTHAHTSCVLCLAISQSCHYTYCQIISIAAVKCIWVISVWEHGAEERLCCKKIIRNSSLCVCILFQLKSFEAGRITKNVLYIQCNP